MKDIGNELTKFFNEFSNEKKNLKKWKKEFGVTNYNKLVKMFGDKEICLPAYLTGTRDGYHYYSVNFVTGEIYDATEWSDGKGEYGGVVEYEKIKKTFDKTLLEELN